MIFNVSLIMGDISQFSDFAAGVRAGERLIALIKEIGSNFAAKPPATEEQLVCIVDYIRRFTPANRPCPAVEGFIRTVLRADEANGEILTTLGASSFVTDQVASAPCCNLPNGAPLVQFAYWSGDEDGDAWVFDFGSGVIRCLPVSTSGASLVQVRAASYGVFYYLDHFVAVLRADAIRRGWLKDGPEANKTRLDNRH